MGLEWKSNVAGVIIIFALMCCGWIKINVIITSRVKSNGIVGECNDDLGAALKAICGVIVVVIN